MHPFNMQELERLHVCVLNLLPFTRHNKKQKYYKRCTNFILFSSTEGLPYLMSTTRKCVRTWSKNLSRGRKFCTLHPEKYICRIPQYCRVPQRSSYPHILFAHSKIRNGNYMELLLLKRLVSTNFVSGFEN